MLDASKASALPLHYCFLDVKGAYGRVQRPLLRDVLGRHGLGRNLKGAVQALYTDPAYAVTVKGRVGPSVPSCAGVKQGCPLSPRLFGRTSFMGYIASLLAPLSPHDFAAGTAAEFGTSSMRTMSSLWIKPKGLQLITDATSRF